MLKISNVNIYQKKTYSKISFGVNADRATSFFKTSSDYRQAGTIVYEDYTNKTISLIQTIIKFIESNNPKNRFFASKKAGNIGDDKASKKLILELINHNDSHIRKGACKGINNIKDPKIKFDLIAELSNHKHTDVRKEAIILAKAGEDAKLIRLVEQNQTKYSSLYNDNPSVKNRFLRLKIIEQCSSKDPMERKQAINLIKSVKTAREKAKLVKELAGSKHPEVRAATKSLVESIGDKKLCDQILKALNHPFKAVRKLYLDIIPFISLDEEKIRLIQGLASSKHSDVRKAAKTLAETTGNKELTELIENQQRYWRQEKLNQIKAKKSVAINGDETLIVDKTKRQWKRDQERLIRLKIIEKCSNEDPTERKLSESFLNAINSTEEKIRLIKALANSKYPDVRATAKSLAESVGDKTLANKILISVKNPDKHQRKPYLDIIPFISSKEEKIRLIQGLASSKHSDVRKAAKSIAETAGNKELTALVGRQENYWLRNDAEKTANKKSFVFNSDESLTVDKTRRKWQRDLNIKIRSKIIEKSASKDSAERSNDIFGCC